MVPRLNEIGISRTPPAKHEAVRLTHFRQSTGVAVRRLSMHLGEEARDRYPPLSPDPERSRYLAHSDQAVGSRGADPQLLGGPREVLYVVRE